MGPKACYNAYITLVIREMLRFTRIWVQTILPPAITMGLYFIIFGNLIGSRMGEMQGQSYIDYIVPGLILMSVITNSYSNVVASFFSSKYQRNIEEMLISPMPNWIILAGYVTGGVMRGLAVGLIVTVVAAFFTDLRLENPLVAVLVLLMTSVLFSIGGLINAIYARSFDDISIIPTFVLTPLTYLGGVFYSIDLLPEFWQDVSLLNPILYMVNALRYSVLGVSDIGVTTALTLIFGFNVLFAWVCLYLMHKGTGIKS